MVVPYCFIRKTGLRVFRFLIFCRFILLHLQLSELFKCSKFAAGICCHLPAKNYAGYQTIDSCGTKGYFESGQTRASQLACLLQQTSPRHNT